MVLLSPTSSSSLASLRTSSSLCSSNRSDSASSLSFSPVSNRSLRDSISSSNSFVRSWSISIFFWLRSSTDCSSYSFPLSSSASISFPKVVRFSQLNSSRSSFSFSLKSSVMSSCRVWFSRIVCSASNNFPRKSEISSSNVLLWFFSPSISPLILCISSVRSCSLDFRIVSLRPYSLATSEAFLQACNEWERSSTFPLVYRLNFLFFPSLNLRRTVSNQSSTSCFKSKNSLRPSPVDSDAVSMLRACSVNLGIFSSSTRTSSRMASNFSSFTVRSWDLKVSDSQNSSNSAWILSPSLNDPLNSYNFERIPWRCLASLWYFSETSSRCSFFFFTFSPMVFTCSRRFLTNSSAPCGLSKFSALSSSSAMPS